MEIAILRQLLKTSDGAQAPGETSTQANDKPQGSEDDAEEETMMVEIAIQSDQRVSHKKQTQIPIKTQTEKPKDDEFVDVCGYIGGGVETISGFQQQNFQEHLSGIPVNADNAQTENLHKIKRNYREKSKNNSTNAIGWGATTTCYVASIAVSPPTSFLSGAGRV